MFKVGDKVIVIDQLKIAEKQTMYPYRTGYVFIVGEITEGSHELEISEKGDRSWYTKEECIKLHTPLDELL